MRLDFSHMPLKTKAFSEQPMTFCDPEPRNLLSAMTDLAAIETGDRRAREYWQQTQLRNLLAHAAQRSAFWRQRIGTKKISATILASLPVLTRSELIRQVQSEGSLLAAGDRMPVKSHATSGSSGTPVRFFVSEMNTRYNLIRSTAQFFIEELDLTQNRTELFSEPVADKHGFTVKKTDSWLGALKNFAQSGINRDIRYLRPNPALIQEIEREAIGYLVAAPWTVETLLRVIEPAALKRAGMVMWISHGAAISPQLREVFSALGIKVRSNYSSEEVGMIGAECPDVAGHYHVATSNVMVDIRSDEDVRIGDAKLGRVLVTHLHSYATPFIRYDIGDLASLAERCPCGHDGPTLSHIHGRSKNFLKHGDGSLSPFHVDAGELLKVAEFEEYRIRQTDLGQIVMEIGGRDSLTPAETAGLIGLIEAHAGAGFEVEAKVVPKIDWGAGSKRLGFRNELL